MSDEAKKETTDTSAYTEIFDKKQAYFDEVVPVLEKLKEVCEKNGLPLLAWVIYQHDEETTGHGCLMIAPGEYGAVKKMGLLGNIADGSLSLQKAALLVSLSNMLAGLAEGDDK